jgi:histidinol-phosphate aminotransferase
MTDDLPASLFNPLLTDIYRTPEPTPLPPDMIRLDRNERVEPWLPEALECIVASMKSRLSPYPDVTGLYRLLSVHTSLPIERLLLVPGSDAAFRALAHVFVQPGDRVAMLDPSYQMYPIYVRMFGGTPVPIAVRDDLTVDLAEINEAARTSKMLWLANPNQPSGTLVPVDRVMAIVRAAKSTNTIVVVDEAYYPFSDATVIDEINEHSNLVVVRTFSKAYGLAGVRLGFFAGPASIVSAAFKVRASFDINALAIAAAEWALGQPDRVADYLRETARSATLLREVAARHSLSAPPSSANFQLIKVGPRFDPAAIKRACWDEGYAIAGPVGKGVFADYIRVTLGTVDIISRFARTLDRMLESRSVSAPPAAQESRR